MFRASVRLIGARLSDAIDDMLIGDYAFVDDDGRVYADVDYARHRLERIGATASAGRRRDACPVGVAVGGSTVIGRPARRRTAA